ncbi:ribosomal protein S3, putative (apicoplast) [Plasmodium gallinaceum]|uniref:Ribosomal protein S3, putative n=1 Tax=Plasmodium gallinaceum TaxID=5849 RepID=H7CDX2_PLAGA|nr:ribosomal protein S3, putative [Plasmodium gallinaceum]BAL70742.1 small subunit ribosomal protein 3 [Plasmodium gallinaceum]CRG98231.1 ribosomal protein S3, putative [Plasmodium gallinaceum]
MGQKVHPLIFRSNIYKNYLNNFYININKNKYYLINILLIYFLYYNLYRVFDYKYNYYININIYFYINKFIVIFLLFNYINLKYIFILFNYFNYYYYNIYNFICYLKIKYINNYYNNINVIMFYVKKYYIKYKSLKLIFDFIYNNFLKYNNNIKGLKIKVSGRFKNNLKTKTEIYIYGIISLNILNNNIKYLNNIINTKQGILSIKIWLNN